MVVDVGGIQPLMLSLSGLTIIPTTVTTYFYEDDEDEGDPPSEEESNNTHPNYDTDS